MANKGLQFEWCIYHLVAMTNPKKFDTDPNAKTAKANYAASDKSVQSCISEQTPERTNCTGYLSSPA